MDRKVKPMNDQMLTDEILLEAEDWHQKITTGANAATLRPAFKAWYEENPLHQEAYAQVFMCDDAKVNFHTTERQVAANDNPSIVVRFGALAACLMVLFLAAGQYFTDPDYIEYQTQTAELRDIQLTDGTMITLGASSHLRVADFDQDTRQVELLEGEALFDVAHNADKPFLVSSDSTTVEVLGTQFTVNKSSNYISVALLRGKVNVRQITDTNILPFLEKEKTVTLEPAQTVAVVNGALMRPQAQKIEQMADWVDGKRSYFDAPLSLVIADINRYSATPVHIVDPAIQNLPVTLVFGLNQIDSILQSLPKILPVTLSKGPNGTVIRKAT